MSQTATSYDDDLHRRAYQRMVCALETRDLFVFHAASSPVTISARDVTDDGALPLRLRAGRVEVRWYPSTDDWAVVLDATLARYLLDDEREGSVPEPVGQE